MLLKNLNLKPNQEINNNYNNNEKIKIYINDIKILIILIIYINKYYFKKYLNV